MPRDEHETPMMRAMRIRKMAAVALEKLTATRNLAKIERGQIYEKVDIEAGMLVYVHRKPPLESRAKRGVLVWEGPALVLVKESEHRIYVSLRHKLCLVSVDQLRLATPEEQRADLLRKQEVVGVGKDTSLVRDLRLNPDPDEQYKAITDPMCCSSTA